MIRHSHLNKRLMLEWIRACADDGAAMPSDDAIMDRFNLSSTESARTLLADLADAGEITIRGAGPDRVIALGKRPAADMAPAKPRNPVKRTSDAEVDRTVSKIMASIKRNRGAVDGFTDAEEGDPDADAPADDYLTVLREETAKIDDAPEPVEPLFERMQRAVKADPPKMIPAEKRATPDDYISALRTERKRLDAVAPPPPPPPAKRQVAFHIASEQHARLEERARERQQPVGPYVRDFMITVLDAETPPNVKPRVPAEVWRAFCDDRLRRGRDFHQFLADMMVLGVEAMRHEGVMR